MPVDSTHPEYNRIKGRWYLVRKIVENDAKELIRNVDPSDPSRSRQYKDDAILTNFTNLTKVGLVGLVFKYPPKAQVPTEIDYILDDASGDGLTLEQLCQRITGDLLQTGRYGLLVDYPPTSGYLTKEDVNNEANYARIKPYPAESIINWQTKQLGSKVVLSLVVLCEIVDELADDGFAWIERKYYRVLRLNNENVYEQYYYNQEGEIIDYIVPQDAEGKPFNVIPFTFIGSENNDSCVDTIPLYDLSVVNLGHYRNSADYEESIFLCGQPTIFLNASISPDEFASLYPSGIKFGCRAGYNLGENGSATLLQANPNQLADTAMMRKEEQAAAIGARLIAPPGGRETAEGARIRYGSQHSALYTITKNISRAMEESLGYVCKFMGAESTEVEFDLNTQFYDDSADPNLIAQQIMLLDRGIIQTNEIRDSLRKSGVIENDTTDVGIEYTPIEVDPFMGSTDDGND
jgi:hypothetical protein